MGAVAAAGALASPAPARAQAAPGGADSPATRPDSAASARADSASRRAQSVRRPAWYERLSLRGYAQVRYNRLLETNPSLVCQQCDRSIGRNGAFSIRRARLVVSGDVHERVSVYIQPDLATDVGSDKHVAQLRDAYFDVYLDQGRTYRVRFGQSKIPFGFENLQSSSNRLPLDRADPLNSALPNERDIGVLFYWSPGEARRRFRVLTDSGLKGSGDYGVFGAGVFNGQTANRNEQNNGLHAVARLAYPFRLANGQFVELGAQGYHGRFVIPAAQRSPGVAGPAEFLDERIAGSLVVYPQPFGLQAEWNVGRGPEFDPGSSSIRTRRLGGGYVQAMYRARRAGQTVTPFLRAQRYDGGKKLETDARHYRVRELEGGVEWLPVSAFELTASYVTSDRRFEDAATIGNREEGHFLRLQAQFNY